MEGTEQVKDFMTPMDQLIWAPSGTTLKEANNIIWDNKINQLPIVDAEGRLEYMVFRKDYDSHKVTRTSFWIPASVMLSAQASTQETLRKEYPLW